jgi:hypothetical protein
VRDAYLAIGIHATHSQNLADYQPLDLNHQILFSFIIICSSFLQFSLLASYSAR